MSEQAPCPDGIDLSGKYTDGLLSKTQMTLLHHPETYSLVVFNDKLVQYAQEQGGSGWDIDLKKSIESDLNKKEALPGEKVRKKEKAGAGKRPNEHKEWGYYVDRAEVILGVFKVKQPTEEDLKLAEFAIDKVRQPLYRARCYAELGRYTGDMSPALKAANDMTTKPEFEAYAGDYYVQALTFICRMQIAIRDIEGAKETAELMPPNDQAYMRIDIAVVTGKKDDITDAYNTIARIEGPSFKGYRTRDMEKAIQGIQINRAQGYYKNLTS